MPMVGKKKFPYTEKGMKEADMAAKKSKMKKVMGEYKEGTLHSGKKGPVVKNRKQAVAIAMSEAKMPKKKKGK